MKWAYRLECDLVNRGTELMLEVSVNLWQASKLFVFPSLILTRDERGQQNEWPQAERLRLFSIRDRDLSLRHDTQEAGFSYSASQETVFWNWPLISKQCQI